LSLPVGKLPAGLVEIIMKVTFAAIAFLLAAAAAACNTVEGVGEDVSAAGNAVDEAAEDAKN
jgi:predicted small secreted protein